MLNSFFIQQSGLSGWKQIGTGVQPAPLTGESFFLAESGSYLGLKTNKPQSVFHIVEEGNAGTILTLQASGTDIIDQNSKDINTYVNFQDSSGDVGHVGFDISGFNHLRFVNKIEQKNDPYIIFTNSGSEDQVSITKEGNFGVNKLDPTGKIHVVQSGSGIGSNHPNNNIAIFQMTGSDENPEFTLKSDGKLGINNYSPRYTVDISGHAYADSGISTLKADSYIYGYEENYLSGQEMGTAGAPNIVIDFNGRSFRNLTLTGSGSHFFTTRGGTDLGENEMKSVSVRLYASGNPASFTFHNDIDFLGYVPTGLATNGVGVISFNSFGPSVSDTIAVFRQPGDILQGPPGSNGLGLQGEPGEEFRNKIIGGEFGSNPWQRLLPNQTGFYNVQSGQYTADRFVYCSTGDAVFDIFKDRDAPDYENWFFGVGQSPNYVTTGSLKIVCTGVDSGMHTGNTYADGKYNEKFNMLEHRIEGHNIKDILTDNCTLNFWAKSDNFTGLMPISLRNHDNTISYVDAYDLCNTGLWRKYSIFIPPITGTSGNAILESSFNLDTGVGLRIGWTFAASSGLNCPTGTFNGSSTTKNIYGQDVTGTSGQWISGFYVGLSGAGGAASMAEYSGAHIKIAGPEFKQGWIAGPEECNLRSQQQELELCKRYYERLDFNDGDSIGIGQCVATGQSAIHGGTLNIHDLLRTGNSFAGVPLNYQDKIKTPSISGSGSLATTDFTWEQTLLDSTGYHSETKTQSFISGTVTGNPLIGGHSTTLKASGDYYFFIDAEI